MENHLFAFIGIAASGKTEVARHVCRKHGFRYIPSVTSRPPRPGNTDEYKHISKKQFENHIEKGDFLEYTFFNGNYYGKLKEDVRAHLEKGHCVYTLTADQVKNLKNQHPKMQLVWVTPEEPVFEIIEKRLRNRNVHSREEISGKMTTAYEELEIIKELHKDNFIDHVITTVESDYDFALNQMDEAVKKTVKK